MLSTKNAFDSIHSYDLGQIIGRGGFARVYRARHRISGADVAIKVIEKDKMKQMKMAERVQNELEIHPSLPAHPHIVKAITSFEDESCHYLVMELCPKGNFYRYLRRKGRLSESSAKGVVGQLLQALSHLHSEGVIHRDLKLSNILLVDESEDASDMAKDNAEGGEADGSHASPGNGHVRSSVNSIFTISSSSQSSGSSSSGVSNSNIAIKLCDFGLAVHMEHPDEEHYTMCGTPNYIAPEIASHNAHGYPADLWSVGCLFYTMLVGHPPFEENVGDRGTSSPTATSILGNGSCKNVSRNVAATGGSNNMGYHQSSHVKNMSVKGTLDRIITGTYKVPDDVSLSDAGRRFLKKLLSMNPAHRQSAVEMLKNPYFHKDSCTAFARNSVALGLNADHEMRNPPIINNFIRGMDNTSNAKSPAPAARFGGGSGSVSALPTPVARHSNSVWVSETRVKSPMSLKMQTRHHLQRDASRWSSDGEQHDADDEVIQINFDVSKTRPKLGMAPSPVPKLDPMRLSPSPPPSPLPGTSQMIPISQARDSGDRDLECVSFATIDMECDPPFHGFDSHQSHAQNEEQEMRHLSRPQPSDEPSFVSSSSAHRRRLQKPQDANGHGHGHGKVLQPYPESQSTHHNLTMSQRVTCDWGNGIKSAVGAGGHSRSEMPNTRARLPLAQSMQLARQVLQERSIQQLSSQPQSMLSARNSISSSWVSQIQNLRSSMSQSQSQRTHFNRENVRPEEQVAAVASSRREHMGMERRQPLEERMLTTNNVATNHNNRHPLSVLAQSTSSSLTASSTSTSSFVDVTRSLDGIPVRNALVRTSQSFPQQQQSMNQSTRESFSSSQNSDVRQLWTSDANILKPFCYVTPENELVILTKERDVFFCVPVQSRNGKASFARLFLSCLKPLSLRVGRSTSKIDKEIRALITKYSENLASGGAGASKSGSSIFSAVYSSVECSIIDSENRLHGDTNLWVNEHCLSNLAPAIGQAYGRVCQILRVIMCRVPKVILYLSVSTITELLEAAGSALHDEEDILFVGDAEEGSDGNRDGDTSDGERSLGDSGDTNNNKRRPLSEAAAHSIEAIEVNEVSMFTTTTGNTNATTKESASRSNSSSSSSPMRTSGAGSRAQGNGSASANGKSRIGKGVNTNAQINLKCMLMSNPPLPDFCAQWADGTYLRYSLSTGHVCVDCPEGKPERGSIASRYAGMEGTMQAAVQAFRDEGHRSDVDASMNDTFNNNTSGGTDCLFSSTLSSSRMSYNRSFAFPSSNKDQELERSCYAGLVSSAVHFEGQLDGESGGLVGQNVNNRIKGYVKIAQVALKKIFLVQNENNNNGNGYFTGNAAAGGNARSSAQETIVCML